MAGINGYLGIYALNSGIIGFTAKKSTRKDRGKTVEDLQRQVGQIQEDNAKGSELAAQQRRAELAVQIPQRATKDDLLALLDSDVYKNVLERKYFDGVEPKGEKGYKGRKSMEYTGLAVLKTIDFLNQNLRGLPEDRSYADEGKSTVCNITGRELLRSVCRKEPERDALKEALRALDRLILIKVKIINKGVGAQSDTAYHIFREKHPANMPAKGVAEEISLTRLGQLAVNNL